MVPHVLFAVILSLAPQLGAATARRYAVLVEREATRSRIDPLLLASFITVESSWNRYAISPTYDVGLCQIHVSKHSFPHLRAHEWKLFDPRTNLRYCGRLIRWWRAYHKRACRKGRHTWLGHMAFGYRVHNNDHAEKVYKLYHKLREKHLPES